MCIRDRAAAASISERDAEGIEVGVEASGLLVGGAETAHVDEVRRAASVAQRASAGLPLPQPRRSRVLDADES
eukprot:10237045-Lingulodinium_polyedra.AAC.1